MFVIALNLANNKLEHIRSCKGPAEASKILCNIHKMRSLSNHFFSDAANSLHARYKKVITSSTTFNRIKAFMNQLTSLDTREKRRCCLDFTPQFATLLQTLNHHSGENANDEIIIEYVTTCLMYELSRRKEKNTRGDHVLIMLC